jgi:hypothetical protein
MAKMLEMMSFLITPLVPPLLLLQRSSASHDEEKTRLASDDANGIWTAVVVGIDHETSGSAATQRTPAA